MNAHYKTHLVYNLHLENKNNIREYHEASGGEITRRKKGGKEENNRTTIDGVIWRQHSKLRLTFKNYFTLLPYFIFHCITTAIYLVFWALTIMQLSTSLEWFKNIWNEIHEIGSFARWWHPMSKYKLQTMVNCLPQNNWMK